MFDKRYEYWPTMAFYWPLYIWGPWQAIRAGHPCFFSALNPGMEGGGIGFGSKYEIGQMVPDRYNPATVRILPEVSENEANQLWDQLCKECLKNGRGNELSPFVAKPDIGYRGRLVKMVRSKEELAEYRRKHPLPMLLQEKISLSEEYGVLYFRRSGAQHGTVTSLTTKEFLTVTGDGQQTIADLLARHPRGSTQIARLKREIKGELNRIPAAGETVALGEIGNHNLGTRFIDARELISPALTHRFDQLADEMPGFCYGRFDLKAESLEAVARGDFMILEINGALAEPTHLYDAEKNNYFTAVKDILAHWQIIGTLSRENMRRGAKPMSLVAMLKKLWWFRDYAKLVKRLATESS
ncbi:MAG: hypothetical protein AAF741_04970 [Bacteroidota bacterium]